MKSITTLICVITFCIQLVNAQQSIQKSFPINGIDEVQLDINWADVIVTYEDINEVQVDYDVTINGTYNNDAIEIESKVRKGKLLIETNIDFDDIDKMVTLIDHNGNKTIMTNAEFEKSDIRRSGWNSMNFGYQTDGQVTIKIPNRLKTSIEATYGDIEATHPGLSSNHELAFHSTYGFVDLSIPASTATDIDLSTSYGEIFTDHDIKVTDDRTKIKDCQFGDHVVATLNGQPKGSIALEATYDNIYLRKI